MGRSSSAGRWTSGGVKESLDHRSSCRLLKKAVTLRAVIPSKSEPQAVFKNSGGKPHMTSFFVNGKPVQVDVDPATPLLWVLRDSLEITGTKFGCGMALCGACTVHLDGKAIRSCVAPVSRVEGKHVTT